MKTRASFLSTRKLPVRSAARLCRPELGLRRDDRGRIEVCRLLRLLERRTCVSKRPRSTRYDEQGVLEAVVEEKLATARGRMVMEHQWQPLVALIETLQPMEDRKRKCGSASSWRFCLMTKRSFVREGQKCYLEYWYFLRC